MKRMSAKEQQCVVVVVADDNDGSNHVVCRTVGQLVCPTAISPVPLVLVAISQTLV